MQKLGVGVRKNAQQMAQLPFDFVLDVVIVGFGIVVRHHDIRGLDVDESRRWKAGIEAEDGIGRSSRFRDPVVRHSTVSTQVVVDKSEKEMIV